MQIDQTTLPIVEEQINIETRRNKTGTVRVSTQTDHVEEMVRAELERDDVKIVRVAINREVTEIPQIRTEGDETIIPIFEEVLVVQKRLMLKEELHITRRLSTEVVEIPVNLRKQRAVIEKLDALTTPTIEDSQND